MLDRRGTEEGVSRLSKFLNVASWVMAIGVLALGIAVRVTGLSVRGLLRLILN